MRSQPRLRGSLAVVLVVLAAAATTACSDAPPTPGSFERPNVVWIVADDMSLEVGAWGDPVARTPNLDRLASEGTRYTNAFATSGVCGPSRAALITGMYATSIGAHHMRSLDRGYQPVPPPDVKTFTEYLRAAGYYTSNANKLDYQFSGIGDGAPITNWDEPAGDWRGRAPGQPFFAYETLLETHESNLFGDTSRTDTDPSRVSVPPYYPDTPLVRRDLAKHYDNVARVDVRVGEILAKLEEDGVAENTIVFFFPDNGRGFPRDKRWAYDGGIHEPLVVRWPKHLAAGAVDDRLVSYVDFAPTVLALAGVPVPEHMQGRAFLGPGAGPERELAFAAADRHDQAEDRIRVVRDARFAYVRNYRPELPYGQSVAFRNNLATMKEIFRLHDEGTLAPPADWYYRATKPVEELYDTVADPFQLVNLAGDGGHRDVLERMRAAHEAWVEETGDLGAVPESELAETFWPGGVQPKTPPPLPSSTGGAFDAPVTVAVDEPVPGASIAYTFEPGEDAHWLLYTSPIAVETSGTLRLRAVRYGWAESDEVRACFAIGGAATPCA
jgi:arylsulfatase A-like enzyme